MKIASCLFLLLAGIRSLAQCPDGTVVLEGNHCAGDTLTVHASGRVSQIVWYNGSQVVKTVTSTTTTSPVTVVAGGNGLGNAANQLYLPSQIYLDGNDNLYVADEGNGRIQKFPPGSTGATNGTTVVQPGGPAVPFMSGVYLDKSGNIYVMHGVILQKWAPGAASGVNLASILESGAGTNNVDQIFVDAAGNIYVPENNRVLKVAPGATNAVIIAGGPIPGTASSQLNYPTGVYVDNAGNMYIADSKNNRIQKWAPGATAGTTVAGGNGAGSASNQLDDPLNLCLDAAGNMYIADANNYRVQKWAPGATEGTTVAGGNGPGSALDQLSVPADVFLDSKGFLYITDYYNERVLKCQPTSTYAIDTTLITNVAGTYTAVVTSEGGCTLTTNALVVRPVLHPDLTITASANPVCAGDSILFTAHSDNTGFTPSYQWQVSGQQDGENSPVYNDLPSNGETVTCSVRDTSACAFATSNSIIPIVNPSPEVAPEQVFPLAWGQSITLEPAVTGDISSYSWSPATGLTDTTIRDPVADPSATTQYTLQVTAPDGCIASGLITVKIVTQLRIPNAFTPNEDGKNDVFYIMGGPAGSVIRDFAIFNRWGQKIFQVHDVTPGDPNYGWKGDYRGTLCPPDTYVYIIGMVFGDGKSQVIKGTVLLVR